MGLLIFFFLMVMIVSFLCSIMEAVLLSTPFSYLKIQEGRGNKAAIKILQLKQDIDRPLSAILSLNTVAHTVGAAGVGAQANIVFGEAYFGITSAVLTLLILVVTEIIPKTIGARFWKKLMGISATIIKGMIIIAYPLVVLSAFTTRFFSKKGEEKTISREDIAILASIGTDEGVFIEKENKIIQNLMRLKNLKASDILTPRVVVAFADENMKLADFLADKGFLRFSRIPVYSGNPENITGYVIRQSVFENLAEDNNEMKLKDIKRDIVIVHDFRPLYSVWETLLEKKEHIALVVDEYGGVDGILTMEDLIETLLGYEIVDEKDTIENMQQYARERWKMRQAKYDLLNQSDKEK